MIADLTADEVARFHSKIDRRPEGCWRWTGETNNKGYGRFVIYRAGGRHRLLAHRLAFILATGMDPADQLLRHSCDTPSCCRPSHLSAGTQTENMQDAKARGRINRTGLDQWRAEQRSRALARVAAGRKPCRRCGETKSLEDFSVASANVDRRNYWCKSCVADYRLTRKSGAA